MVRNVGGGNRSKAFARKNLVAKERGLTTSSCEDELYVRVTKMSGGAICLASTLDGKEVQCHIRGKFRGRGKRDNFIQVGTWLLVGRRTWIASGDQCDVICVYDDHDKARLRNMVTSVNWATFVAYDGMHSGGTEDDNGLIDFSNEATHALLPPPTIDPVSASTADIITTDTGTLIQVDDI